jgi:hypothetical protein
MKAFFISTFSGLIMVLLPYSILTFFVRKYTPTNEIGVAASIIVLIIGLILLFFGGYLAGRLLDNKRDEHIVNAKLVFVTTWLYIGTFGLLCNLFFNEKAYPLKITFEIGAILTFLRAKSAI